MRKKIIKIDVCVRTCVRASVCVCGSRGVSVVHCNVELARTVSILSCNVMHTHAHRVTDTPQGKPANCSFDRICAPDVQWIHRISLNGTAFASSTRWDDSFRLNAINGSHFNVLPSQSISPERMNWVHLNSLPRGVYSALVATVCTMPHAHSIRCNGPTSLHFTE